jgi:hypothetical protein
VCPPTAEPGDLNRLVAAAERTRPGLMGLRLGVLLILLAYSGMRPSEAFALRPEHLDLQRRRIDLDWQLDEHGDLQPLKNSRKRQIVMDPEARAALQRLLPHIDGNDLLFRTVQGAVLNTKSKWSYYWEPIRKSVEGLETMDVYELRHYCATMLINNGASPQDVAKQFGHSDGGRLILELYGHPDEELILDRLEQVMVNRKHTTPRNVNGMAVLRQSPTVSLFSAGVRIQNTMPYSASEFHHLDANAGDVADRVRALLDQWFDHLPAAAQPQIGDRFRSSADATHRGAFWELYVHEMGQRLDFDVVVDIGNDATDERRPDFRLRRALTDMQIEATVIFGDDIVGTDNRPRVQQLYDAIDRLENREFPRRCGRAPSLR